MAISTEEKKANTPMMPLDAPPVPEELEESTGEMPLKGMNPPPDASFHDDFDFSQHGEAEEPLMPPQATPMPEFRLPPEAPVLPGERQEPDFLGMQDLRHPLAQEVEKQKNNFREQEQMPAFDLPFSDAVQQPQFKFYETASPEASQKDLPPLPEIQEEKPVDVEEMMLQQEQMQASEIPEQKQDPFQKQKEFIPLDHLTRVAEQLVMMDEDLDLGKDTLYRLTDIYTGEVELLSQWQAALIKIEMEQAAIDKLLFKA